MPSIFSPTFITEFGLMRGIESAVTRILDTTDSKCYPQATWIDMGCGTRPYEYLFENVKYLGVDVEESGRPGHMKKPDIYYDGNKLPFGEASIDGVLSTQVLEHVSNPAAYIMEAKRVLKPGGCLVMSVPFVWQEHEQPYDYFRFTSFGISALLKENGFDIEEVHKTSGTLETLAQCLSVWCVCNLTINVRGFSRLVAVFLCIPIQAIGLVLQRILPDRKELFLDIVVVARRKSGLSEMAR